MSTEPPITSDEERRKLLQPTPREDQVLELLQTHYGKNVRILKQLESYDDCNFMVEADGVQYLLKIHNGVESQDYCQALQDGSVSCRGSVIHLQNAMMHALDRAGVCASVPVLSKKTAEAVILAHLPVVSQQQQQQQQDPSSPLAVRLLRWVHGTPMSSVLHLPIEVLADAGRFLGRIDKALDDLVSSNEQYDASLDQAAARYHQWDGKNTLQLRDFVHNIDNLRRRQLVESILDAFEKEIVNTGDCGQFRQGINHGDFNDANIVLSDDLQVSGVIDFGDSVKSWRVLDVSVAMAYAMLTVYGKKDRSISAAAALLRGFTSVYPLTDLERKHLVLLVVCRLACSVTLGAYSYKKNPENKYLLFHAEPAWKSLELLWGYDSVQRPKVIEAANCLFKQACDPPILLEDAAVINCSDLALPDPVVVDLLRTVRNVNSELQPVPKKQKKDSNGKPFITFVTGNAKKLEEVQRIMGFHIDSPFGLTNMKVDLPELQGDPTEIAKEKCHVAAEKVGGAVMTEDTSLCFNALNGLPGPYIKWFLDSCGHEGLNKMIGSFDDKSAYAQTIVAFCPGPGQDCIIFDGRTSGKIVMPRGKLDFGWDPIFEPLEGGGKTYAEMSKDEKDAISHRSRAFRQLKSYLDENAATIISHID